MSNQDRDSDGAGDALNEKLLLLSDAEEQVCKVLQLSADTCAELEKLPFSDREQLQTLSSAMITALQSIRASIITSLDAIQPADSQQVSSGSVDDTIPIVAALDRF
eukprot:gene11304-13150_t